MREPDGGAQLVPIHGRSQEFSIRKDPALLTLIIKPNPLIEYQFTESLTGEWEIVFKPPSFVCFDKGCNLWHPWMHYADRSPRWTLEEAITIITRGLDMMLKGRKQDDAVYALRHAHTQEIIPREILCL